jgi:hypothetical protein
MAESLTKEITQNQIELDYSQSNLEKAPNSMIELRDGGVLRDSPILLIAEEDRLIEVPQTHPEYATL